MPFDEGISIYDILLKLDILDSVMAIALTSNVVKKDRWKDSIPKENDKLEFLNFVGGG
jgi:sulfur carrier protein